MNNTTVKITDLELAELCHNTTEFVRGLYHSSNLVKDSNKNTHINGVLIGKVLPKESMGEVIDNISQMIDDENKFVKKYGMQIYDAVVNMKLWITKDGFQNIKDLIKVVSYISSSKPTEEEAPNDKEEMNLREVMESVSPGTGGMLYDTYLAIFGKTKKPLSPDELDKISEDISSEKGDSSHKCDCGGKCKPEENLTSGEDNHECKCGGNCSTNDKDSKFKLNIMSIYAPSEKVKGGELKDNVPVEPSEKDIMNDVSRMGIAEALIIESCNRLNGPKLVEFTNIIKAVMEHLEYCDEQDIDKYRAAAVVGMKEFDDHIKYYEADREYANLKMAIKTRVEYLDKCDFYSKYVKDLYNIAITLPSWNNIILGDRTNRVKNLKVALISNSIINQGEYALELLEFAHRFHDAYMASKCGPKADMWGIPERDIKNIVNNLCIV